MLKLDSHEIQIGYKYLKRSLIPFGREDIFYDKFGENTIFMPMISLYLVCLITKSLRTLSKDQSGRYHLTDIILQFHVLKDLGPKCE